MPTPALTPIWLAIARRGKSGAWVTSRTQVGCLEAQTRPGKPSPVLNCCSSLTDRNCAEPSMLVNQAGLHCKCELSLLGSQAWPSAQPVASHTVRSTIDIAE